MPHWYLSEKWSAGSQSFPSLSSSSDARLRSSLSAVSVMTVQKRRAEGCQDSRIWRVVGIYSNKERLLAGGEDEGKSCNECIVERYGDVCIL